MNVRPTDDQFLNNIIQGASGVAPLEDSWSLDGEPVCYSEPEETTVAPGYSASGVCATEIDPMALTIAHGSLNDSLRELGVTDAETVLRAYLSSGHEDQRQVALDLYYQIFETLYYLEQEYGETVSGLRERIAALRGEIAARLVALAGTSERGREFLAALVEQLATLGQTVTLPLPPSPHPAHPSRPVISYSREQWIEVVRVAAKGPVSREETARPEEIIEQPTVKERPLPAGGAIPTGHSDPATAATRQPARNIPYLDGESSSISTEVEEIARESRARLPERRFEHALQELRDQIATARRLPWWPGEEPAAQ
jgi:hypothetical protein